MMEMLKRALLDMLNPVTMQAVSNGDGTIRIEEGDRALREEGRDWPLCATTMIGYRRLTQLQEAIETVVREDIPGDVIETGVWRGGAAILAASLLDHLGDDRKVWLCDSFEGLPAPDSAYPADVGDLHHAVDFLRASQEEVKANFHRFDVSIERCRFVKGWFRDTLPIAGNWSILRLDGDMYESTVQGLTLYDDLAYGGFCIVDDYGAVEGCRRAIDERFDLVMEKIDWTGVYWRK